MRISLYTPLRPTTLRAYFASGSWQHGNWWRTMTRRQSQIPLVCIHCVTCQELHRFSQDLESQPRLCRLQYAQVREPVSSLHSRCKPVTEVSSFGIWPSALFKEFPPKVPPTTFSPNGPAAAGPLAPPTHPSWMAKGMVRPRQHSTQQLGSS